VVSYTAHTIRPEFKLGFFVAVRIGPKGVRRLGLRAFFVISLSRWLAVERRCTPKFGWASTSITTPA
jgi:hypothetical protein